MKIPHLISLFGVLFFSHKVSAEGENEVKRGLFPFMAFIYYPDETVVDSTGARFIHDAILIKPDWLVSSAIDHSVLDNIPLGFPRKTLLARAGAIAIEVNLPLNEDEDEQEREIIKIIRPSIHNVEVWWLTDITLLKTLLPFNLTPAVGVTSISSKREFVDKNCIILVYAKRYGNTTDEKILMQFAVELLPPSIENCGNQFSGTTMTCAVDSDETKNAVYEADFCQGNSGGPLMCEGEVMALQTYIENYCKQPHLYQLLSAWKTFIACSTKDGCSSPECAAMCTVLNKDNMVSSTEISLISTDPSPVFLSSSELTEATSETESEETTETTIIQTTETSTEVSEVPSEITSVITEETALLYERTQPNTTTIAEEASTTITTSSTTNTPLTAPTNAERSWPKQKLTDSEKNEEKEKLDWNPIVERRVQYVHRSTSKSESIMCLTPGLIVICGIIKHFI